jgi:DNA primase
MVACVESRDGRFLGVHRTWLDVTTANLKAPAEPQKAALGAISGGAIRLAAKLTETIVLCEGIEDGLSIIEAIGFTVWVAPGTSGLRSVQLPDCVRTVIIAGDNDAPGREAVSATAMRFHSERRNVRIAYPSAGKDFNDLMRASA